MKIFETKTYGTPTTYFYIFGKEIASKSDGVVKIGEWYTGWHTWLPDVHYSECGYETANAEIIISLFGWHSVFRLPWKSKRFPNGDCDEPRYGFAIHSNKLWIYTGGDGNLGNKKSHWITWYLPFTYSKPCCRWDVECEKMENGKSEIVMIEGNLLEYTSFGDYSTHKDIRTGAVYTKNVYEYNYTDSFDGAVIPCKFWVEEREWRPKWLDWTGLFKKIYRYIDIKFDDEVGKNKGSWKGGVMGCSYELLPGENPMDCIRRMEREKKF